MLRRPLTSSFLRVRVFCEIQSRGYPTPDFSPEEKARSLNPKVDPGLVPPPKDMRFVKHAVRIPPTPQGQYQRPPSHKQEYQMFSYAEDPLTEHPPVSVILLKSVDGVGRRGDVCTVPSNDYHNVLFPSGCAIYATSYDLKLLEQQKLAGEFSRLSPEDVISFELKKFIRVLHQTVVPITMTFDDQWILEKRHLRINLLRAGFNVKEENIVLPQDQLNGPNKNLQGKLITFYVKHTDHSVVPVLGRINQVSAKGHQVLVAGQDTKENLKDSDIERTRQPVHYSVEPMNLSDEEIQTLMASESREAQSQRT